MAVRPLKIYPDPVLRQKCKPVEEVDDEVRSLLDDLVQSMYAHRGIGLAAPQIGEPVRVAVVDVGQQEGEPDVIELVNPEIVERSDETAEYEEGCLSLPEEYETVIRPARVTVRALDREGKSIEIEADGLLATALQHEIDHLDGRLFIDYLSRLKRSLIDKRLRKRRAERAAG
ncbi:MAG: peptide deformylase [Deltaproteobacteria bacterium]|nr:MAG: peptide deformylase [Deltaproteobacteria bacterium]